MSTKVGEILVKQGLLKPEQLAQAIDEQRKNSGKLSAEIVRLGFLKDPQILRALEKAYQVPGVDVSTFEIDPTVSALVKRDLCEKHCLIPLQKAGQTLVVAFSDPSNIMIREDLRFITKMKIQPVVGTENAIQAGIDKHYAALNIKTMDSGGGNLDSSIDENFDFDAQSSEVIDNSESGSEAPIVKFVNAVLADAIRKKVSDIHFEPYEKRYRVRFRVDGNLHEATAPPPGAGAAIASRIKIMSKLDIAEKRRPQDGRLKVRTVKGKEMDFRVSVLPCIWGEKNCPAAFG